VQVWKLEFAEIAAPDTPVPVGPSSVTSWLAVIVIWGERIAPRRSGAGGAGGVSSTSPTIRAPASMTKLPVTLIVSVAGARVLGTVRRPVLAMRSVCGIVNVSDDPVSVIGAETTHSPPSD